MFYSSKLSSALRFGDVIKGCITLIPYIKDHDVFMRSTIDLFVPKYSVIISPCCSIGDKQISLCPLIEIRPAFFRNPFFEEDLTRINRKMEPSQSVSPEQWMIFGEAERLKRIAKGNEYAFDELFVYDKNEKFESYEINSLFRGKIITNYYMIDFKNTYQLQSEKIVTPKNAPLEIKILELTVETREELRSKIANYYSRRPEEDLIELKL